MRKLLFQVHLWTGLILSIPFLLLGLSGSLLVFDQDILAAMNAKPALQASAGPLGSLDAIAAAAAKAAPDLRITTINAPGKSRAPVEVRMSSGFGRFGGPPGFGPPGVGAPPGFAPERGGAPNFARQGGLGGPRRGARPGAGRGGPPPGFGAQTVVSIDPVNYAVLRVEKQDGPAPILLPAHQFHESFMIPEIGRSVVGWFGAGMLLMGLSGIVLWWPKKSQWARSFAIRRGARGYVFNRDLHGMIGVWLWFVFIAVTASGVAISFPRQTSALLGQPAQGPGRDFREGPGVGPPVGEPVSLDAALAAARKAVPEARLLSVSPAIRPGLPVRVSMAQPGWMQGAPSITVQVSAPDNISVRDPRRASVGESVQAWLRALHEGAGLSIIYKILVFLSGLAPTIFVITGVSMWLVKRKGSKAATPEA